MPTVKLVSVTPDAEKTMAYIARVSNPANQENPNHGKLLKYCIQHDHWSVFEHAYMTIEIETSLAIATQILRHRSFTFQQFSQRYADVQLLTKNIVNPQLRTQDLKNRQNSVDNLSPDLQKQFSAKIDRLFEESTALYQELLEAGVAKECARFILPQATSTRLYMTGSCRSWIHYIDLRSAHGTQKEHMEIALLCKNVFAGQFPVVAEALEWHEPQAKNEVAV